MKRKYRVMLFLVGLCCPGTPALAEIPAPAHQELPGWPLYELEGMSFRLPSSYTDLPLQVLQLAQVAAKADPSLGSLSQEKGTDLSPVQFLAKSDDGVLLTVSREPAHSTLEAALTALSDQVTYRQVRQIVIPIQERPTGRLVADLIVMGIPLTQVFYVLQEGGYAWTFSFSLANNDLPSQEALFEEILGTVVFQ